MIGPRWARGLSERPWRFPRLDRSPPGSAGSLTADPLDREHPEAHHDEKPTTAAPAGNRHRYQHGSDPVSTSAEPAVSSFQPRRQSPLVGPSASEGAYSPASRPFRLVR